MASVQLPEVWLRGPIAGIPALLQPVAHALLQSREELEALLSGFPDALLWERPGGTAAVAFHLQHLSGVLDRLFTYAAGQPLSDEQLTYLGKEGQRDDAVTVSLLLARFQQQVDRSLGQLQRTNETTLTQERLVGRKGLPSTTLGLLFHAAEHTMRHTGQLLVTVNVLGAGIAG
ncbi:DinB family protein [Chitinophaga pendula]|uniref:DinB family protein n=1 Tax=Chitinophaga TaxID=79328 RepID=UPI000BAF4A83|nr:MULTISPECIES: DinB family protein [Chitinophaga]ASZ12336.1 metal-dependent hydrolase [Chitinophaga sp. MD30]UCJ10070.1 DinB family protein [Chitinophaga pendula]